MKLQKSQPIEAAHASVSYCLVEPTEIWLRHPPQKRTPTKWTKKLAAFRTLAREHRCGTI